MDFNFEAGEVILIDKPVNWTSFDVVKKIRNAIRIKKVGHAGTLDPLATGLLILCTGKKTKEIDLVQQQEKEYSGTIILGATTPSFDLETSVVPSLKDTSGITLQDVIAATESFKGAIEQVPPVFSAIKIDGVRLYTKARKGEEVIIKPRSVFISDFIIEEFEGNIIKFKVTCSKGTYIRSLANDLGQVLGVGAYLGSLKRERIGSYNVKDALQLEDFLLKLKK